LLSLHDDTSDILNYSAVGTADDDDNVFSSGGAIMEALEKQDPDMKNAIEQEQVLSKMKPRQSLVQQSKKPVGFKIEPVVVKNNKIVKGATNKMVPKYQSAV
jgi:hypothetical protein